MKIEIELTDEMITEAKRTKDHGTSCNVALARALLDALPQSTLQERAYNVLYPNYHDAHWKSERWDVDVAVMHMARWLYENGRDRYWYVGRFEPSPASHSPRGRYMACHFESSTEYFDSLVDAYAHVVVGLGE